MLTQEENELLTRVGAGTPGGELLRRYWQPICAVGELTAERPKKRVAMLSEQLVVFRKRGGGYGLVREQCSHRGASLYYGFLEDEGIRCAYHGWLYDDTGRCLEQPFEPKSATFKDRVRHPAYPVEELGGLLFAYLGPPEHKPLLPRWDALVRGDGTREIEIRQVTDCNWLQPMENSVDSTHTQFLHLEYAARTKGLKPGIDFTQGSIAWYGFQPFEWGILRSSGYEEGDRQIITYARPLIFPNMMRLRSEFRGRENSMHWRVPIDDVTTRIFVAHFRPSPDGSIVEQPEVPFSDGPIWTNEEGEFLMDTFQSQDGMAWETQGPLYDRTKEQLGASDRGLAMYRRMLREQIKIVQDGGEPMALVRDPKRNEMIDLGGEWMGADRPGEQDSAGERGPSHSGPRFEDIFDDSRHEVAEVPVGAARAAKT